MSKVVICASPHPFGIIQSIAAMMAEGLRSNNIDVEVFLVTENAGGKDLIKWLKINAVDAIIVLNPEVLRIRVGFRRLLSSIDTNIFIYLLDDPAYHFKALNYVFKKSRQRILLMLPEFQQKQEVDKYIKTLSITNASTVFFPWAGPEINGKDINGDPKYDIAVFCTLDQQITQGVKLTDLAQEIQSKFGSQSVEDRLRKYAVEEYATSVADMMYALTGLRLNYSDPTSVSLWMRLDSLLKEQRRLELAHQLIDVANTKKLSLIICGTGWEKLPDLPKTITLAGAVPYDMQFQVFKESRFLINLDPNWTNGVHDRVFNAMSVGCGVFTNRNTLLESDFIDGESVLMFNSLEELSKLIDERRDVARNAFDPYSRSHTWTVRMSTLLDYLK